MADITLTTTESNIVVDASNNIITVSSSPTTVVVGEGSTIDNAQIRAALGNTAPILYDAATGIFSFDANATFSGKTTDNLPQGTSNIYFSTTGAAVNTTNLPEGTNLYFTAARARGNVSATTATGITYNSGTGVFSLASIPNSSLTNTTVTINGKSVALGSSNTLTTSDIGEGTNLYFTAARTRGNVSAVDAGGLGSFTYSSATGAFTYTGPSDSDVRGLISAANTTTGHGNISYNNSTGVITFDRVTPANILGEITAGNVKLKQYSETVFNAGNQAGSITLNVANGSIQQLNLVGNITALNFTNITAGSTVTLILRQDAVGFRRLITTGWTNWDFVGDNTTLTVDPLAYDILTVTYDGTNYFASLVNFNTPVIQNSQLANSNVRINGVTIALGSQGNIDTFNSNVTVNGNLNVTGNLNYQNVTDLYVTDQKITLNSNATVNANVEIISNRPTATSTMLKWNEPATRWEFTNNGTTYLPIATNTTDLAEGANLYFTTARANTAIDNRLIGGTGISYNAGTIAVDFTEFDTGNITEGTNLYFTAARARGNISAAENITYNSASGVIGLANSLANVSTITSQANVNLTLNTSNALVVTQKYKNTDVFSGNISSDGYAFFASNAYGGNVVASYNGTANIQNFIFASGSATAGSNAITGVSVIDYFENPTSLSNVPANSIVSLNENSPYPFPFGTYVTSVDAANSIIYMSQAASYTQDLSLGTLAFFIHPVLLDTTTGQALRLLSEFDNNGSGSKTTLVFSNPLFAGRYGYPQSGFNISNFNVITAGNAGNYTLGNVSALMVGRNKLQSPTSVLQAPRGMIVGNGDLTNRAETDTIASFGVNVLWDGTDTSYRNTPLTQILVKNYTDNNLQTGSGRSTFGPRLFFTAAEGNFNKPYAETYPRNNLELGRITWWCASQASPSLGTSSPPAFINAIANRDMTGGHNGGVGMYLTVSPNNNAGRRGLFAAHQLGTTLIASSNTTTTGAGQPIVFAPMATDSNGNSVATFNNTLAATNYQWANINYDNATAKSGTRLSITNGASTVAGRNGNISLVLDRNDNGAGFGNKEWAFKLQPGNTSLVMTEDDVIRTTFAPGGNVDISGNINLTGRLLGYDRVYGEFCYTAGNITPAAADTVYTLPFDTTNMASDVVANNTSRINIVKPGIFKLIMSLQVKNSNNSADHTLRFWLRKNGADVANSATLVTPLKLQESVIAMDWMVESDGDDYWEIAYYVNSTNISFPNYTSISSPVTAPSCPPIIVNVIPVGA